MYVVILSRVFCCLCVCFVVNVAVVFVVDLPLQVLSQLVLLYNLCRCFKCCCCVFDLSESSANWSCCMSMFTVDVFVVVLF